MFPPRICAAVAAIALLAAPGSALAASLTENFDSSAVGWETTGLWRIHERPDAVGVSGGIGGILSDVAPGARLPVAWDGTSAAWFGEPSTGTYCVGYAAVEQHPSDGCRSDGRVEGTLTSPSFALPTAPAALEFHAWWEIAAGSFETADLMTAEYSTDDGATWITAARLNPSGPPFGSLHQAYTSGGLRAAGVWRAYSVDLTPALGSQAVRVRFHFDSVDNRGQGFRGLLIDGVSVPGSRLLTSNADGGLTQEQPPGLPNGPELGTAVVIEPVSGRSTYRPPGARRATALVRATVVPLGTVVDARAGAVRLTTATDAGGGTQTGTFHDATFQIRQQPGEALVELALRGGRFPRCPRGCTSELHIRPTIRRLWGSSTGSFKTRGRYASATVRGTNWLIEDGPGHTLVHVRRGSTLVRDFVRDRNVILHQGDTYITRVLYTNRQPGNPRFGRQYTLRVRGGRVVHVYKTRRIVLHRG